MDINRNQYFMIGLILLALGVQFRKVEYYVLTQEASHFIAKKMKRPVPTSMTRMPRTSTLQSQPSRNQMQPSFMQSQPLMHLPESKRTVRPPDWLAWMLLSVGAVLTLHSLAMKKPG